MSRKNKLIFLSIMSQAIHKHFLPMQMQRKLRLIYDDGTTCTLRESSMRKKNNQLLLTRRQVLQAYIFPTMGDLDFSNGIDFYFLSRLR